jgi:hypothetical protein
MHLMLPAEDEQAVMEAGWGELHPWHYRGVREILVYAPCNEDELETVKIIVSASYAYVMSSAKPDHKHAHCCHLSLLHGPNGAIDLNPTGLIPMGPIQDFTIPTDRKALSNPNNSN